MRNLPPPSTKFFFLSRFGCLVFVLVLAACSKTADAPLASSSVESSVPFDYEYAPDKPGKIQSVNFNGQTFTYRVVDGLVVIGGDMILGSVEEIEAKIKEAQSILSTQSFGDTDFLGNYKYWPDGKVYYTFDTSLGSAQRADVNQAIEHWEDATMLRFYARSTGARIVFRTKDPNCFSGVGYPGSNKIVYTNIGAGCGVAATIHEIGHAVALNHEQSRCDRDNFVGVYTSRAEADQRFNFEKYCSTGAQQSTYDPYSIMHYSKSAFSTNAVACYNGNDSFCTILPKPGSGIDKNRMGRSTRLTSRDVSGIFNYYRNQSPCDGDPNGCTWRGFTVGGTRGGSYDFTLSSSGSRAMVIQGGQTKVAAGLNKRKADGTYQNLQFKIIATDGVQKFDSGTLAPGTYQWYVHADGSGSGSVDMFVETR